MNEENYVYDQPALSRSEADLNANVQDPEPKYDQPPLSRIEYLLQNLSAGGGSFIKIKGTVEDVDDLPSSGNEEGDLYFVGPDSSGNFDEYVYSESKEDFEKLGSTEIDTSQFVKKSGDVMTGPLFNNPLMAGPGIAEREVRLGYYGNYQDAIEAFLASNRTAADAAAFSSAIDRATTVIWQSGVGPFNGRTGLFDGIGFQTHWEGIAGPSWNLPLATAKYNLLPNGHYIAIFDNAFSVKKRNIIYTDEIGFVPIDVKGVAETMADLPNNPENGWTYLSSDITTETMNDVVYNYIYSSKLGGWFGAGPGAEAPSSTNPRDWVHPYLAGRTDYTSVTASGEMILDEEGLIPDGEIVHKAFMDAKISKSITDAASDYLPTDANLEVVESTVYNSQTQQSVTTKYIQGISGYTPTQPMDLMTLTATQLLISSSFETLLLSYIDSHIKTQAEYDALQDKTGFWFIKEATT